jgi:DNA-binding transcriptional ArsR family regulator
MDIEFVFNSKPRIKILKILAKLGQLNTTQIAHKLSINYRTTSNHLKLLEDEGILLCKKYGRICSYRFNENSKANAVRELLETWEARELTFQVFHRKKDFYINVIY